MKYLVHTLLIVCLLVHCATAQVMKRSFSKPIGQSASADAVKPFTVLPPALVLACAHTDTFSWSWGDLISEMDGLLTVNFWDGWGRCVINRNGVVLSSNGNFNTKDSMVRIHIAENMQLYTNATYQNATHADARGAIYMARRYHYVSIGFPPTWTNSLNFCPVANNNQKKSIRIEFAQNKWTIARSELPEFVKGNEVSAIYFYTGRGREFLAH